MTELNWRSLIREGFDYDLYANQIWLPFLSQEGSGKAASIYSHLLAASTVWVTRLDGISLPKMPHIDPSEAILMDLHRRWLAAIGSFEFDQVIDYRNTRGEAYSCTFGDMARHVINHGTYHRGQISSLFATQNLDFPDTDFIGFAFERDGRE